MTCAPADAAAMPHSPTPEPSSRTRLPATLLLNDGVDASESSSPSHPSSNRRVSTSAPSHTRQNPVVAATLYPSSKKFGSTQSSSSADWFDAAPVLASSASPPSPDISRRTMRRLTPQNGNTSVASLHSAMSPSPARCDGDAFIFDVTFLTRLVGAAETHRSARETRTHLIRWPPAR